MGGTVVGAAAMMTMMVGTAPPPTMDCSAMTLTTGLIAADLGITARGGQRTLLLLTAGPRMLVSEGQSPRDRGGQRP
jgi:hypothetical protein